jgi:hypothetical protein
MHFDAFSQFVEILNLLPCLRRVALNGVLWYDVDSDSDSEEDAPLPTYLPGSLADFVANCRFQQMAPVLRWLPSQPSIRRQAIAMGASSYINPDTALVSDVLRTLSGSLEHLIVCDAPRTFGGSPSLVHTIAFAYPVVSSSGPLVPHRAPHTRNRWHPTSATQQP